MTVITPNPELGILALDPAATTGFAHSKGHYGIWSIGSGGASLARLREFILDAHHDWGVKKIAVEYASFGSPHVSTQARHNELLGVIRLAASEIGVKVTTFAPTSIKKFITGNGRADKSQVVASVKTLLGITPQTDDVADAAAILLMSEQGYQTNTKKKSTKRRRSAKRRPGTQERLW